MNRGSKVLVGIIFFLIVLSVSATFYKTVILQDFEVTGVFVEFPTEDSTYVWFVYDNEEYELELETTNYDEIVNATADKIGVPVSELDADFLDYLHTAYDEGEVTGTGEEETVEEEESVGETENEEAQSDESEEATSTTETSEGGTEEAIIEQEI